MKLLFFKVILNLFFFSIFKQFKMEVEDISTEEFSDVSQDREEGFSFDTAQNEQIQQLKQKLEDLDNDILPELQKV